MSDSEEECVSGGECDQREETEGDEVRESAVRIPIRKTLQECLRDDVLTPSVECRMKTMFENELVDEAFFTAFALTHDYSDPSLRGGILLGEDARMLSLLKAGAPPGAAFFLVRRKVRISPCTTKEEDFISRTSVPDFIASSKEIKGEYETGPRKFSAEWYPVGPPSPLITIADRLEIRDFEVLCLDGVPMWDKNRISFTHEPISGINWLKVTYHAWVLVCLRVEDYLTFLLQEFCYLEPLLRNLSHYRVDPKWWDLAVERVRSFLRDGSEDFENKQDIINLVCRTMTMYPEEFGDVVKDFLSSLSTMSDAVAECAVMHNQVEAVLHLMPRRSAKYARKAAQALLTLPNADIPVQWGENENVVNLALRTVGVTVTTGQGSRRILRVRKPIEPKNAAAKETFRVQNRKVEDAGEDNDVSRIFKKLLRCNNAYPDPVSGRLLARLAASPLVVAQGDHVVIRSLALSPPTFIASLGIEVDRIESFYKSQDETVKLHSFLKIKDARDFATRFNKLSQFTVLAEAEGGGKKSQVKLRKIWYNEKEEMRYANASITCIR